MRKKCSQPRDKRDKRFFLASHQTMFCCYFDSPKQVDENELETAKQRYRDIQARERQKMTNWTVGELKALWSEGKRFGILTTHVNDPVAVQQRMKEEAGVEVVFRLDVRLDRDTTYFIMSEQNKNYTG